MPNNIIEQMVASDKMARDFGFEWPNVQMIIDYAISECREIASAIYEQESAQRIQEEIGDLLHVAISLCIFAGFNVEQTLNKADQKFLKRMAALKEISQKRGLNTLAGQSMEFMLQLWSEAKIATAD